MRVKTLTIRILKELYNDKRTIALVIVAPVLIMTLIYYVLFGGDAQYTIGIINAPDSFITNIKDNDDDDTDVTFKEIDKSDVKEDIKNKNIIAAVDMDDNFENVKIYMDGTSSTDAKKVESIIKSSIISSVQDESKDKMEDAKDNLDKIVDNLKMISKKMPALNIKLPDDNISDDLEMKETDFDTDYIYGSEDQSFFDNYASALIGIIVFFFVFLLSGINFLKERTSGTLEKLLSTPITRREIVFGYTIGFSILALIQTVILISYVVYGLGIVQMGSIWYVFLVNILTAITALTLGMLLSTLANGEFQFIQFIPIIILPQIFLCGLFNLTGVLEKIGHIVPLYYTTRALKEVMIRGNGFSSISYDCMILALFSVVFIILNILLLKKHREI